MFQCFGSVSDSVTFRGSLRGTAAVTSSALAGHVAAWVATGQTILLQNVHFKLESQCSDEVVIENPLSPECAPRSVGDSSSSTGPFGAGSAVGVTIAAVVTVAGLVVMLLVAVMCWRKKRLRKVDVGRHPRYI